MRKFPPLFILAVLCLAFPASSEAAVAYVQIQGHRSPTAQVGQSFVLAALAYDEERKIITDAVDLRWSSSGAPVSLEYVNERNEKYETTQCVRVTPSAPGEAVITATAGGSGACDSVDINVMEQRLYVELSTGILNRLNDFNARIALEGMTLDIADLPPPTEEHVAFRRAFRSRWNAEPRPLTNLTANAPLSFSPRDGYAQPYGRAVRPGMHLALTNSVRGDMLPLQCTFFYTWNELTALLARSVTPETPPEAPELFRALTLTFQGNTGPVPMVGRGGVAARTAEDVGALTLDPSGAGLTLRLTLWLANLQNQGGPQILEGRLVVPDGTADGSLAGTLWALENPLGSGSVPNNGSSGGSGGGCALPGNGLSAAALAAASIFFRKGR